MDLSTRQGRREQGLLIQNAVEQAGLSVEELANRIGCSRALIYQYLSGTTLAQPDRLQHIARETGVSLAYFFGTAETSASRSATNEQADVRRAISDSIRRLEELARYQSSPVDWQAVASTSEQIVSLASQAEDREAEARALLNLGRARVRMGEFSRATDPLFTAIDLFAGAGQGALEADARQVLGHALLSLGRAAEARDQFTRVAGGDQWQARWSGAVSLAAVAEQVGDYREAMARCDEAASILEEGISSQDIARGMLYVNANRVNLYMAGGDFLSARALAEKCLSEAEAQGNSDQHLEARLNLGMCAVWLGDWAAAHRTLTASAQLARFLGDRSREAMARATLAILLAALCDCNPSIEQAKDALAAALSQGDHRAELFAQMALADAYFALDRDSEARYHANQALAVASSLRLALYETECRSRIARLSIQLDDLEEAEEALSRALRSADRLGARHLEAEATLLQAELRLKRGERAGAEESAAKALQLSEEMDLKPQVWAAELMRARVLHTKPKAHAEQSLYATERAVASIERVRVQLRDAGIADTMLEDRQRLAGYQLRVDLLHELGRDDEADEFIENAAWPPLSRGRGEKSERAQGV
jgi:tetratricopeptide (TPR) repeat protein